MDLLDGCAEFGRLYDFMDNRDEITNKAKRQAMIHVGRNVPKALRDAGYTEDSAMHIGRGIWSFRLSRSEQSTTVKDSNQNER